MSNTLKFGNGLWATKEGSTLAYNDENGNFKPLPFNFTRAGSATRVNKEGLIEVVSNNEPRIDFSNDSKGALLLEPTRTNRFLHSEDLTQFDLSSSGIGASNPVVTSNYGISPNGTQNADRVQLYAGTDASGNSRITETFSIFATTETISVYLKSNDGQEHIIDIIQSNSVQNTATVTSEWKRFSFTNVNTSPDVYGIGLTGSNGETADILAWGFQLEEGSYATSYIPTSGSIGTRDTEQGIDGGAGTPIFSNTSAVWFIDLERIGIDTDSTGSAAALRNSSFSQQIRLHFDHPASNIRFRDGLDGFATISTITGMSANVRKKIALRIDGSTLSTFSNGSKIGSDYTAPNAFDLGEIDFSAMGFKIHDMRFYNTALSDSELQALTS